MLKLFQISLWSTLDKYVNFLNSLLIYTLLQKNPFFYLCTLLDKSFVKSTENIQIAYFMSFYCIFEFHFD